jgi:hypothetical protein
MADERTYGFSRDDATSLVQSISNAEGWYPEIKPRGGGTLRVQVIMTEDLFAAVNTKRDPSTASARILQRTSGGDLSLSTDTVTIVNRFMHISVDAGTYAKAEWIDGEWQLYAADCSAGSSSGSI